MSGLKKKSPWKPSFQAKALRCELDKITAGSATRHFKHSIHIIRREAKETVKKLSDAITNGNI